MHNKLLFDCLLFQFPRGKRVRVQVSGEWAKVYYGSFTTEFSPIEKIDTCNETKGLKILFQIRTAMMINDMYGYV